MIVAPIVISIEVYDTSSIVMRRPLWASTHAYQVEFLRGPYDREQVEIHCSDQKVPWPVLSARWEWTLVAMGTQVKVNLNLATLAVCIISHNIGGQ